MTTHHSLASAWQQLRSKEINCQQALQLLIDERGIVNLKYLDKGVGDRFFKDFPDKNSLPPVIPLLLWQNCYYLGCPVDVPFDTIRKISDRTFTEIKILPIADRSYRAWFYRENIDPNRISATRLINPLTGEIDEQDVSVTTELFLDQAVDQISRIKTIISGALQNRASDIHLEPTTEGLRVRYRIDGILRNITVLPIDMGRRVVVALKVMCDMDIAESRCPQDGRISDKYASNETSSVGLDMRVSTLPCVGGEKAVIRLLPAENPFTGLEDLGFSDTGLETYKNWLNQPQGMIIFTGPTGSGKTSTLYTSLLSLATEHVNVVTVEDPVEYVLPGITQTQVNERAGMTFAAGLRAILRQDPDIVMLGEIRDRETADTAVRAALTGHLVLTTLHTNDAAGAIPRLKDIGPDPGLISDALLGIVAQRLVRRVCPHCSEPYSPTNNDLKILGLDTEELSASFSKIQDVNGTKLAIAQIPPFNPAKFQNNDNSSFSGWRKGKGCSNCFSSGYYGREAIVELLDINDPVRELIYEGTMTDLQQYLYASGFISFRISAIDKVTQGITTVEEVQRVLPRAALARKSYGTLT
jgi:type II secretory ATPase GspE/PulE/Tfp pilus assembly ATPase PilB-like protein